MRKITLLLFSIFYLVSFTNNNLSPTPLDELEECSEEVSAIELLRVCNILPPSLTSTGSSCNTASGIAFFGGPNCHNSVIMRIFVANLTGYDNLPSFNGPHQLPSSMEDLYVEVDFDFDGIFETQIGPIDDFYYHGFKVPGVLLPGTHYIFQHDLDLTSYMDNFDPCNGQVPPGYGGHLEIQLVNVNGDLFDFYPHGGPDDVITCELFRETCELCTDRNGNPLNTDCSYSEPKYRAPICVDCNTPCQSNFSTLQIPSDNNEPTLLITKTKISPNPFKDEFFIEFEGTKEDKIQIEIIDLTGKQIALYSLPAMQGERTASIKLENVPKGIYFCKLTMGKSSSTSKIVKL